MAEIFVENWERDALLREEQTHDLSALVDGARTGERESLERLAGIFHKKIYRLVYCRTGSRLDAEDLTQEVFLEMSKSFSKLRKSANFKAWLYRIALNRITDFHRKRKLHSLLAMKAANEAPEPPGTPHNPLDQLLAKEFWYQFHHLTNKMSRNEREVFILRYVEQFGIREIAETLRRSESAVKTHLYRALKKFTKSSEFRVLLKGGDS